MFQRQLTFGEAVKRALTLNYCNFNGRASRSEYWWFALFSLIASLIISIVFFKSETMTSIVSGIFALATLLPSLGLSIRRLHDTGRSGWWVLINFVPIIGWIVYIVFVVGESQNVPNQYGPVPNVEQR